MTNLTDAERQAEREAATKAYDQVVASARMVDVRLLKYDFEVKPEYYASRLGTANEGVQLSYDHEFASINYYADDGLLIGEIHWAVSGKLGRKTPLKIKAVYMIVYANVPDVGIQHSGEFMKRVGRMASYPYFRAFVAQTSWASQADLPTLPILR